MTPIGDTPVVMNAPNKWRRCQLYKDTLGAVLEKPSTVLIMRVVALDEFNQLGVHQFAAFGLGERSQRLHCIVAHVPVASIV
jgi:hypothetical protein